MQARNRKEAGRTVLPCVICVVLPLALASACGAGESVSRDADKASDGTEGEKESRPRSPFALEKPSRPGARRGVVTLSNGRTYCGTITFTRDKKIEVFDPVGEQWHRFNPGELARISISVAVATEQEHWRWKEAGSDDRTRVSQKGYTDIRFSVTVTTRDGKTVTGHLLGTVIYIQPDGGGRRRKFFLRQHHRSKDGKVPVFVKLVQFEVVAAAVK